MHLPSRDPSTSGRCLPQTATGNTTHRSTYVCKYICCVKEVSETTIHSLRRSVALPCLPHLVGQNKHQNICILCSFHHISHSNLHTTHIRTCLYTHTLTAHTHTQTHAHTHIHAHTRTFQCIPTDTRTFICLYEIVIMVTVTALSSNT